MDKKIFTQKVKNQCSIELITNPYFIQALKDFEKMGFIKVNKKTVEILDYKGLETYLNNFGKLET